MSAANDRQVAGAHYVSEYQHWDLVWNLGLGYFPGQITKYALRWHKKNGAQDLEKAVHFAEKYVELLEEGFGDVAGAHRATSVERRLEAFFTANAPIAGRTAQIFRLLCHAHDVACVKTVRRLLLEQLEELKASQPSPAYVNQS